MRLFRPPIRCMVICLFILGPVGFIGCVSVQCRTCSLELPPLRRLEVFTFFVLHVVFVVIVSSLWRWRGFFRDRMRLPIDGCVLHALCFFLGESYHSSFCLFFIVLVLSLLFHVVKEFSISDWAHFGCVGRDQGVAVSVKICTLSIALVHNRTEKKNGEEKFDRSLRVQ